MKKSFHRIFALLLTVVCCLAVACGGKDNTDTQVSFAAHVDVEGAVSKKGISVHRYKEPNKPSAEKVDSLNVSWWYNWGPRPLNEYVQGEFVPMVWGKQDMNEETLTYIEEGYKAGKFKKLLTFNEPDLSVQANLTVDEALSYWPRLEQMGMPLSSPAVSYYDPKAGNEWLDGFMKKTKEKGYRVDFIAIHLYQSFYSEGVVQQLKSTLDALYQKYGLPIWLTEFGAIDIIARDSLSSIIGANKKPSASCTQKNVDKYVVEATNFLERCGYVERYSWFLDNFDRENGYRPWEAPYTALYEHDDTLSDTGKTYQTITSNLPLVLDTVKLVEGEREKAYKQTISVRGGEGNYYFKASGLPKGFTLSGDGVLTGKGETRGVFPITVTITDSGKPNRKQTLTRIFILTVK